MKVVIIIQARMTSARLPGKVMKEVLGKPLLGYLVERLRRSRLADDVVVATTTNSSDKPIADYCKKVGVECFRGSENDVLKRYYECAKACSADAVVRITGDCPLIDPMVVDSLVGIYRRAYPNVEYISNTKARTFPRGMDAEVFSFAALEEAYKLAEHPYEREHVTPYIFFREGKFAVAHFVCVKGNFSQIRLTVDEPDDFKLVKNVIEELYPSQPEFSLDNIVALFDEHPEWLQINVHVAQKEENHSIEDLQKTEEGKQLFGNGNGNGN